MWPARPMPSLRPSVRSQRQRKRASKFLLCPGIRLQPVPNSFCLPVHTAKSATSGLVQAYAWLTVMKSACWARGHD